MILLFWLFLKKLIEIQVFTKKNQVVWFFGFFGFLVFWLFGFLVFYYFVYPMDRSMFFLF